MEKNREDVLDVSFTSSDVSSTSSSSFHSMDGNSGTIAGIGTNTLHSPTEFHVQNERRRVVIYETVACEEDDIEEISEERLGSFRGESCESTFSPTRPGQSPPAKPQQEAAQAYKEPQPAAQPEEPVAKRTDAPRKRNVIAAAVSTNTITFDAPVSTPPKCTPSPRARLATTTTTPCTSPTQRQGRSPRSSPRVYQFEVESSSSLVPVNQAEALAHRATVSEVSTRMLEVYRKVKHNTRQRILRIFYDRWLLFLRKPTSTSTIGTQTRARLHRRSPRKTNEDVEELNIKCMSSSSSDDDWDPARVAVTDTRKLEEEEKSKRGEQEERKREKKEREERKRRDMERAEREDQEREKREQERREQERADKEMREKEQREWERAEQAKQQERERNERDRQERERREREERERNRREQERRDQEQRRQEEEEERSRKEMKERLSNIQSVSSPAPLFTPGCHPFNFSPVPLPTQGIAATSRPADGIKDKPQGTDLPPRKSAIPACDVSTELSSVVQHPIRVTRF